MDVGLIDIQIYAIEILPTNLIVIFELPLWIYSEVLFVNIGARVLYLWLDMSSGPKLPKYSS